MKNLVNTRDHRDFLDLIMLGLFLILIAVIFIITPNLLDRGYNFFLDLEFRELYSYIYLPTPKSDHPDLFLALSWFCFIFAFFHIPILAARFIMKDAVEKKAGIISGLFFWFGATWLINQLVIKEFEWFTFLGYLIALIGASILIRSVMILAATPFKKR